MKRKNNKAQFQLSFGMIFSMFLIVIFLIVAFIVVKQFLDLSKNVDEMAVVNNLNSKIKQNMQTTTSLTNDVFTGEFGGETKLTHICFYDIEKRLSGEFKDEFENVKAIDENHNFYFYPLRESDIVSAEVIGVNMTSFDSNPYCVKIRDGKFKLKLSREYYEDLVRIE